MAAQGSILHTCLQASSMEAFSQLTFPLSKLVSSCRKLTSTSTGLLFQLLSFSCWKTFFQVCPPLFKYILFSYTFLYLKAFNCIDCAYSVVPFPASLVWVSGDVFHCLGTPSHTCDEHFLSPWYALLNFFGILSLTFVLVPWPKKNFSLNIFFI